MAILYFPRIDDLSATAITREMLEKTPAELSEIAAASHASQFYYPTAAQFVTEGQLLTFREEVLEVARAFNFPGPANNDQRRSFDQKLSTMLFQDLDLTPAEAANREVWNFLTLVLFPDIAKWRYPNEARQIAYPRWMGDDRNVIRKLWWREATLGRELNSRIGEDEAVGIMERPLLGGQTKVARSMVKALLTVEKEFPQVARSELFRACAVNLRRYTPFTALEFFSERETDDFVLRVFRDASQLFVERISSEKRADQQREHPVH